MIASPVSPRIPPCGGLLRTRSMIASAASSSSAATVRAPALELPQLVVQVPDRLGQRLVVGVEQRPQRGQLVWFQIDVLARLGLIGVAFCLLAYLPRRTLRGEVPFP